MCARFTLMLPWAEVARLLGACADVHGKASWNIAPTQQVAILEDTGHERHIVGARWGVSAPWSTKPIINARSETVAGKPTFREALRERRCLIPTTGFYEWQTEGGRKRPYLFRRADGAPFVFAGLVGLYKTNAGVARACTVLTTPASSFVRRFYDRMPAILDEPAWNLWLDRAVTDAAAVTPLLQPAAENLLVAVPVSPRVNSSRNDDAGCVEPVGEVVRP